MMNQYNTPNISGFVDYVIRKTQSKSDKAFCAVMKRADNPAFESGAWEYMVPFCDITSEHQRHAFAIVGAAIVKEAPEQDGESGIGKVLFSVCNNDQNAQEREAKRLRKLISCEKANDLFPILRPLLGYLQDRGNARISYKKLLQDLIYWNESKQIKWVQDFYSKTAISETQGSEA